MAGPEDKSVLQRFEELSNAELASRVADLKQHPEAGMIADMLGQVANKVNDAQWMCGVRISGKRFSVGSPKDILVVEPLTDQELFDRAKYTQGLKRVAKAASGIVLGRARAAYQEIIGEPRTVEASLRDHLVIATIRRSQQNLIPRLHGYIDNLSMSNMLNPYSVEALANMSELERLYPHGPQTPNVTRLDRSLASLRYATAAFVGQANLPEFK